jgi:acetyltransferase-like isoleucine patch superfamily enzyme
MDLETFIHRLENQEPITEESGALAFSIKMTEEAMQITAEMNGSYHSNEERLALMCKLVGRDIPKSFCIYPAFYADFGKNIHFGNNVFVNANCSFQDQGGIYIGNDVLIGHHVVLATLNHDMAPAKRAKLSAKPIHIGNQVWIGANATILPGVTIGKGSVIGAGAVVTKDVEPYSVMGGVPARRIRYLTEDEIRGN